MNFPPQSPTKVTSLRVIPKQERRRQRQLQYKQTSVNRITPTSSWFATPVGHIFLFQVLCTAVLSPLYSTNNAIVDAQTTSSSSSNCRMDIWVYSSMDLCQNIQPPTTTGILYADGKCRTTKDSSSSDSSSSLLPGTYRAACTKDGRKIRFLDSGCTNTDGTCSSNGVVTTIGNYTRNICPQDTSIPSSLYSRLEVPEFNVQNPANATTAGFFACDKLTGKSSSTGNTIQVTFVIFGDCSDPSCGIYDDSIDNNTSPIYVKPSPAPVITDVPTEGSGSTSDPTMNTYEPTATVPVDNPTKSPTTNEPSAEVTSSPTGSPESSPTIAPSARKSSPTIAPSAQVRVETISAGMVLSEVDGSISTTAANVWENITTTHLYQTVQSEGLDVLKIVTQQVQQEQLNEDSQIIKVVSVATIPPQKASNQSYIIRSRYRARTRRAQAASTSWLDHSVRIFFDVTMTFPSSTPENVTAERIFQDAFDTEAERTSYIIQIVNTKSEGLTTTFENVTRIQILNTDNTTIEIPTAAPITNSEAGPTATNPTNNNTPSPPNAESPVVETISANGNSGSSTYVIAGSAVGGIVLLVACGYLVYHRGKKDALNGTATTGDGKGGVGSQTSASSPATEEPRWTNEIIIDPTADDVSTLGGSVLLLGLGSSGMTRNPADEPTASVNHDFDYTKNRYRSGALHEDATIDDGNNTRVTNPTQVTSFSKLGINMNHMDCYAEEDDNSFEQLYQEPRSDDEETIEKMKTYLSAQPPAVSPSFLPATTPPRTAVVSTPGVSTTIYPVTGSNSEQRDSTAAVVVTTFRQPSPARSEKSGGGATTRALPPPPASPGCRFDAVGVTSPVRTASTSRVQASPAPAFGVGTSPARSSSSSRLQYRDPVPIVPAGTSPVRSASTSRLQQPALLPPTGPTRFQIRAPPGLLGMVLDTPGGRRPVVRAIKDNSVLAPDVMVGDYLVEVDCIDTTELSAMEVSNLISTKAHLYRRLVFIRE